MKDVFRYRVIAAYLMNFAWLVAEPVYKSYYGTLDSLAFAIIGIWVAIISLSQKWLRAKFSIIQLLKILVITDIAYMIVLPILAYSGVKYLLLFELLADGPYLALVRANSAKMESIYLGKFKPVVIERLRSELTQRFLYVNLLGLTAGGIIGYITNNLFAIVIIKVMIMAIGVYFEIKSLKSEK